MNMSTVASLDPVSTARSSARAACGV